ncbi:hypothetical protein Aab01nite_40370 [Paractinoplanes abujensis]|nr:hypothetical protein Aab01nite_40370 [Actinoplanes abujensis]
MGRVSMGPAGMGQVGSRQKAWRRVARHVSLLACLASDVPGRTEALRRKEQQPRGGDRPGVKLPHTTPGRTCRRVRRPPPGGRGQRTTVLPCLKARTRECPEPHAQHFAGATLWEPRRETRPPVSARTFERFEHPF